MNTAENFSPGRLLSCVYTDSAPASPSRVKHEFVREYGVASMIETVTGIQGRAEYPLSDEMWAFIEKAALSEDSSAFSPEEIACDDCAVLTLAFENTVSPDSPAVFSKKCIAEPSERKGLEKHLPEIIQSIKTGETAPGLPAVFSVAKPAGPMSALVYAGPEFFAPPAFDPRASSPQAVYAGPEFFNNPSFSPAGVYMPGPFCADCGKSLEDGEETYCAGCAKKRSQPETAGYPENQSSDMQGRFCPNCGAKTEGGNFCSNCGERLND